MNETQIKAKLDSMKKTRKTLGVVTLVVAILAMALLIGYNFLSVTYLKSPEGSDFEKGFAFPGWQMIFWGFGRQFIMQDHLFDPNPFTIVGMLGTLICLIVCTASFGRGKNKSKAIKEFIMAAFLIYSACVLGFFIVPVSTTAAINGQVYMFKTQYLEDPNTTYTAMTAATLSGVAFLVAALVKIANGVFLLYQKSFAAKYAKR